jgi:GNAT superfamily N-acetyltransferase
MIRICFVDGTAEGGDMRSGSSLLDSLPIVGATDADLGLVIELLCEARLRQERQGVDVWHPIDQGRVARDVAAGRVLIARDELGACGTVTVQESDELIWGLDETAALYVHRLVVSPRAKRRGIGVRILGRVGELARQRRKICLRLDTWDRNLKIRRYYEEQGFRHIRDKFFAPAPELPPDYSGTWKSLYELDLSGA